MQISLNWLKDYIDIDCSVEELAQKMTMLGLEIESIERPGEEISDVVIGQILSIEPHPDADKLVVCKTDVGQEEPLQIVCGAKNMKVGDKVPTAVVGASLPGGFKIGARKMRGIQSQGMMCSADELGMGGEHSGLLILPEDMPVGADALPLLGLDDVIMEIEVTPNRGDWASMIGVARELSALFEKDYRIPEVAVREGDTDASDLSSVTIENADLCPRYIGRVLTGVKVGPSPQWLVQRLLAAGQRPINNIVDVTNFVLLETGHPLHAFDYDKLTEHRIVVRTARNGETITTLDGEKRQLDDQMLVIADAAQPVAVAGVMGGLDSEVADSTTTVFLESAYFNPASIRRTARSLGMQTEASQRFQRGADPEMALYAINRAAVLMADLANAEICAGILDEYPNPPAPVDVTLRYGRANEVLGTDIPGDTQQNYLCRLGFTLLDTTPESCRLRTPSWRHDVAQEADLVEEIARLFGYDNIGLTMPAVRQTEHQFAPAERTVMRLRHLLIGQGLNEMVHWTFSSTEDVNRALLAPSCQSMVTLQNPLSENQATLRSSLAPQLLATTATNTHHGNTDVMAFELGPVYKPLDNSELPDQRTSLAVVLSGTNTQKHWSREEQPFDFYDIKGIAEAVLDFFHVTAAFEPCDLGLLTQGRAASVVLDATPVGFLGEVSFPVRAAYGLNQPAYILELDLQDLLERPLPIPQFTPIPTYPASLRDMAVVVDAATPAGKLQEVALEVGGKLLRHVHIFDIYEGKQVPPGKKSVALSLVFQSPEKTLTDKDTQKAWDKILGAFQRDYQAELR